MSRSTTRTRTRVLRKEDLTRSPAGFIRKDEMIRDHAELSRTLASAFLKVSSRCMALRDSDRVDDFIRLHQFSADIREQARTFLRQEALAVRDEPEMPELLMMFATFRLHEVSRTYYEAMAQPLSEEEQAHWKQQVGEAQADLGHILSTL